MSANEERWALLSVQDTTGVVDFARGLAQRGYRLAATPGTGGILKSAGLEVTPVEEITGFPLILDGIVKSMHPRILAGIQADRTNAEDVAECRANGVPLFDVVAVNYAGYQTLGGRLTEHNAVMVAPMALIRAAAGNYKQVLVVAHPRDYPKALEALAAPEGPSVQVRRTLAREAWNAAMHYDMLVAASLETEEATPLPTVLRREYRRVTRLKYGENPHQQAALYAKPYVPGPCVCCARQLRGEALSYNNVVDADKAMGVVLEFAAPGAVIIKHALPVSAAVGDHVDDAVRKAFHAEYASRVGAAVGCNGPVDEQAAKAIVSPGRSIDLVIAADFTDEAVKILETAQEVTGARRLLKVGDVGRPAGTGLHARVALHHVTGGVLAQTIDSGVYGPGGFHVVSQRQPADLELIDLEFAYLMAKHTRSNSTVLAKDGATVAVATAQTSRVEAAYIALHRAGERAQGAVMASDSTLQLPEVSLLADAGVRAIIQTGGATDEDLKVLEACNRRGLAMIVTRMRHFSHS